jgi:hypothetical protein
MTDEEYEKEELRKRALRRKMRNFGATPERDSRSA